MHTACDTSYRMQASTLEHFMVIRLSEELCLGIHAYMRILIWAQMHRGYSLTLTLWDSYILMIYCYS
jgi:hypothetical protein